MDPVYDPNGPAMTAKNWLDAVAAGDLGTAWEITDDDARLAMAQEFCLTYPADPDVVPDRDAAASRIAALGPASGSIWDRFAAWQLPHLLNNYALLFQAGGFGVRMDPEVGAFPEYEVVTLMKTNTGAPEEEILGGEKRIGYEILMHFAADGWRLASTSRKRIVPGWPPSWETLD